MRNLLLISLCVILVSCKSDFITDPNADPMALSESSFLKFSSIEELNGRLEVLMNQNDLELKQTEEKQGFYSFYRKSEEIYGLLRDQKYENQDDIYSAFAKYSQFVEIIDSDGELEAETKLSKSMYKYVINVDRMVQIEEDVYKVFDDYLVSAKANKYQSLLRLNESDVLNLDENSGFKVFKSKVLFQHKNTGHSTSHGDIDWSAEQSKRRVKLEIELDWEGIQLWRIHRIAAQKKVLAIWWNYKADISTEIKWRYDYYGSGYGPWVTHSEKYTYDEVYEDVILWGRGRYFESSDTDDFHFRGFDCTATTDDISNSADLEFEKTEIGTISQADTYYFN